MLCTLYIVHTAYYKYHILYILYTMFYIIRAVYVLYIIRDMYYMYTAYYTYIKVVLCMDVYVRELSNTQLPQYLPTIVRHASRRACGHLMISVGNILKGTQFHDKLATDDAIGMFLSDEVFGQNRDVGYLASVAYCMCQLITSELCVSMLIAGGLIDLTMKHLLDTIDQRALRSDQQRRDQATEAHEHLWAIIVNLAQNKRYDTHIIIHTKTLVALIVKEVREDITVRCTLMDSIALYIYNLSAREDFEQLLAVEEIDELIECIRIIMIKIRSYQSLLLSAFINILVAVPAMRSLALTEEWMNSLRVERNVLPHLQVMYVKYACVLNIYSSEEACYPKLMTLGAHAMM